MEKQCCIFCAQQKIEVVLDYACFDKNHQKPYLTQSFKNEHLQTIKVNRLLESIRLKNNQLTKIDVDFQNSRFYRTFPSRLLYTLSQLFQLSELKLNFEQTPANSLSSFKKIIQTSFTLKNLYINLQDTPISLIDYHSICETLQKLQNIEELQLSVSKNLKEKNIMPLAEAIRQKKNLRYLDIDFQDNISSQDDMNQFFYNLKELSSLNQVRICIDKSNNCVLNDEGGLSWRWLLKSLGENLDVFEFSAQDTDCQIEFWINFFSGLKNNNNLRVLCLNANFKTSRQHSCLEQFLLQVFENLQNLECLNISLDSLNVLLKPLSKCILMNIQHSKIQLNQNQFNLIPSKSDLDILTFQKQKNQEIIRLYLDFLTNNFFIGIIKFLENDVYQQFFDNVKLENQKQALQITCFNKYISQNIPFHSRLIFWDLYF
ncbi:hypothetical protein ABPG73_003719 [Tetrahymena malaccensis]